MRLLNSRKSHFYPVFTARLVASYPALQADFVAVAYDLTPVWSHFFRTLKIQHPSNWAKKPRNDARSVTASRCWSPIAINAHLVAFPRPPAWSHLAAHLVAFRRHLSPR